MLTEQRYSFEEKFPRYSDWLVGVELEQMISHTVTGQPVPLADQLRERLPKRHAETCHDEILTSVVEKATTPHLTVSGIQAELSDYLDSARSILESLGAELRWQGAHPDLVLRRDLLRDYDRTKVCIDRAGPLAPLLTTTGLHVHVGVDRRSAIPVHNCLVKLVPLFAAVAANSPKMSAFEYESASHRAKAWSLALPTCGLPRMFNDWSDLDSNVAHLVRLGYARSPKDLHWPVRPTRYGTLEVRVFDTPPCLDDVVAIAGLVHAVAVQSATTPGWLDDIPFVCWLPDFNGATSIGPHARITSIAGDRKPVTEALGDLIDAMGASIDRVDARRPLDQLRQRVAYAATLPAPAWRPPVAAPRPVRSLGWRDAVAASVGAAASVAAVGFLPLV